MSSGFLAVSLSPKTMNVYLRRHQDTPNDKMKNQIIDLEICFRNVCPTHLEKIGIDVSFLKPWNFETLEV